MKDNSAGQALLEYAAVIIIVTIAIVVGGPYVVNSVNAHFFLIDRSIEDSQDETVDEILP